MPVNPVVATLLSKMLLRRMERCSAHNRVLTATPMVRSAATAVIAAEF